MDLRKSEFNKIGIDIKSTYRERYQRAYNEHDAGDVKPFDWTLGGYRSFLRKQTKNIQYDYRCYKENWVIGFLYTRNEELEQGVIVEYENKGEIPKPHENVEFFVNEKYKVAGTGTASGNTTNIGTITPNDWSRFRNGDGFFADKGEEVFEDYWAHYDSYQSESTYTSWEGYREWKEEIEEDSKDGITLRDFS